MLPSTLQPILQTADQISICDTEDALRYALFECVDRFATRRLPVPDLCVTDL